MPIPTITIKRFASELENDPLYSSRSFVDELVETEWTKLSSQDARQYFKRCNSLEGLLIHVGNDLQKGVPRKYISGWDLDNNVNPVQEVLGLIWSDVLTLDQIISFFIERQLPLPSKYKIYGLLTTQEVLDVIISSIEGFDIKFCIKDVKDAVKIIMERNVNLNDIVNPTPRISEQKESTPGITSFGEKKKRKHTRGEISQKEAAGLCGVSSRLIQKWEKGENTPDKFPGRSNALAFSAWATSYQSQKKLRAAAVSMNRAIPVDPADLEDMEDKNNTWG